jgi:SAM-dependent methyltransferase
VKRFGFEWRHFHDWGWLTEYPKTRYAEEKFYGGLLEHSRAAFWSKSLFGKEDLLPGEAILDAGCGNGRLTNQAAQYGAEVIGVDLGWGVYSAFEHTRSQPNILCAVIYFGCCLQMEDLTVFSQSVCCSKQVMLESLLTHSCAPCGQAA